MKYELLYNDTPFGLTKEVNAKLESGWELYGSPSIAVSPNQMIGIRVYQAVIYKPKPKQPLGMQNL